MTSFFNSFTTMKVGLEDGRALPSLCPGFHFFDQADKEGRDCNDDKRIDHKIQDKIQVHANHPRKMIRAMTVIKT